jgi:hypothetical protein
MSAKRGWEGFRAAGANCGLYCLHLDLSWQVAFTVRSLFRSEKWSTETAYFCSIFHEWAPNVWNYRTSQGLRRCFWNYHTSQCKTRFLELPFIAVRKTQFLELSHIAVRKTRVLSVQNYFTYSCRASCTPVSGKISVNFSSVNYFASYVCCNDVSIKSVSARFICVVYPVQYDEVNHSCKSNTCIILWFIVQSFA